MADLALNGYRSKATCDAVAALVVFLGCFIVYVASPVVQVQDSRYAFLLSENLLTRWSTHLDRYFNEPIPYQVNRIDGHIETAYPLGTPLLSLPYVALYRCLGFSVIDASGQYDARAEDKLQKLFASFLMAGLAAIFYLMARPLLPKGWSLVMAGGAAFGTQLWSTASRAMWSHTWGIFLLGIAIFSIFRHESCRTRPRPLLLGTVLSLLFLVRPTFAIDIAAITFYVIVRDWRKSGQPVSVGSGGWQAVVRKDSICFLLSGTAWLILFSFLFQSVYRRFMPPIYPLSGFEHSHFWAGLYGVLFSPSRGLFVYVPAAAAVLLIVARWWRSLRYRGLAALAVTATLLHILLLARWPNWWGGGSYGPRLATDAMPWIVFLSILAVDAVRRDGSFWRRRTVFLISAFLVACSVAINARGALSPITWVWNGVPVSVDLAPWRANDWRQPQFLFGLIRPPLPKSFPSATGRLSFNGEEVEPYLWYGWNYAEQEGRWTNGKAAGIAFTVAPARAISEIRMKITPFLVKNRVRRQRLKVVLNDRSILDAQFSTGKWEELSIPIRKEYLKPRNTLELTLPDNISPQKATGGASPDSRDLALFVAWMEFR